jgi:alkanesulfonate monooxygenase SsuD/methylene tetrahydromethanopterin reductase-like flavin-dependent oxidoreductase (luciferase family)
MRIGTSCIPRDYRDYAKWVQTAEETGFDHVSTGDSSTLWTDPFVTLTIAAQNSSRLGLSVVGTNPVTRHPVAAAAAAESVQIISGGRLRYALASGDSSVTNIGRLRAKLAEVEKYGRTVQALCSGRSADYEGKSINLDWATLSVPVLLCADGPKLQHLAGEFADGAVLYNGITEEVIQSSVANVAAGASAAGRDIRDMELIWPVVFHLADTVADGVEAVKFSLAGTANRAFRYSLVDKGVPEHLHGGFRGLQAEYKSSQHQQLRGHHFNASLLDKWGLTEYLVERFAIVGPPSYCIERLQEIASYGIDRITLSLNSLDISSQIEVMRRISAEIFPSLSRTQ